MAAAVTGPEADVLGMGGMGPEDMHMFIGEVREEPYNRERAPMLPIQALLLHQLQG